MARLAAPRRDLLPQFTSAGLLGALLMDGDSWLYLLGPNYYGFYHRVATHSLIGMAVMAALSAGIARLLAGVRGWRRFGWYVWENVPATEALPGRAPYWQLYGVALAAALLHFFFDAITGFGNMLPFWPWSDYDASQRIVSSFNPVIALGTIIWWGVMRWKNWKASGDLVWTAAFIIFIAIYLLWMARYGSPAFI